MTSQTYTWKELGAQALADRPGYFMTAAGGNGYRLYKGEPTALTFVGFYKSWNEMFASAVIA